MLQSEIKSIKTNPIPIGFIYVQLPNQLEPSLIWPNVQWESVTPQYANLFFRAEGERSAKFGSTQGESAPRLTRVTNDHEKHPNAGGIQVVPGIWSQYLTTGVYPDQRNNITISFFVSNPEVKPQNTAIRIWKRVHSF